MRIFLSLALLCTTFYAHGQQKKEPVIDMHIHANRADFAGMVPMTICIHNDNYPATTTAESWGDTLMSAVKHCKHPLTSPLTDDEVMNRTLDIFRKRNVIAVTNGVLTEKWKAAAPDRIINSMIYRANGKDLSVDSMRALFRSGKYKVFGEIHGQYRGVHAADTSLAAYWALAEELDIPVGIHIGPGPIGAPYLGWPKYSAKLNSPLQLEPVLQKHPKLRVYIMHAAWPMIDELLAMLWTYPQLYIDISGIITDLNETAFNNYLKRIVEPGFSKRILFGSDSMIWPELVEESIKSIEKASFLSKQQKRDILYNNAARFLKLSREEIARHHQMGNELP